MSPEQLAGEKEALDVRTDVYSLGLLLYRAVSGQEPFPIEGRSLLEIADVIHHQEPTPLTSIPRDLEAIILQALQRERAKRYSSVDAFAADIQHFLRHEPVTARRHSTLESVTKFTKRRPAIAASLAILSLTLAVAATSSAYFGVQAESSAREAETASQHATEELGRARDEEARASREARRSLSVSDHARLDLLIAETEELWPALPGTIPEYDDWLRRVEELFERQEAHVAHIRELQTEVSNPDLDLLTRDRLDWLLEQEQTLMQRFDQFKGKDGLYPAIKPGRPEPRASPKRRSVHSKTNGTKRSSRSR